MKTHTIFLTSVILLATAPVVSGEMAAPSSSDAIQLRYGETSGKAKLSINQDISAGKNKSIASRDFFMNFELTGIAGGITFEITWIKGSYEAHGMNQRLPSSGIKGQTLEMMKADDNRTLLPGDSNIKLEIGTGKMIGGNYPVELALTDIMPELPREPVTIDSTWESSRDMRFLEAWAWTTGHLSSQHRVTGLDEKNGHTIVSVTTTSQARLSDVAGGVAYSGDGDLERVTEWRFDATDGRVLSVSMQQESTGINTLPQGDINVRQLTRVRYSME